MHLLLLYEVVRNRSEKTLAIYWMDELSVHEICMN